MVDVQAIRKRSERAWTAKTPYEAMQREAYEFAIPYRQPAGKHIAPGENRVDRVFDNTAIVSSFRFAGRLQNDLVPPGQEFFKLALGELGKLALAGDDTAVKDLNENLQRDGKVIHSLFQGGEWDTATHEMFLDLAAGTGAMLILKGDAQRPVRYVAVPIEEIALELGAYGDVSGIFYVKKYPARALPDMWPEAKFPEKVARKIKTNPEAEVEVCQDAVWDAKSRRWSLYAYARGDKEGWHTETSRTCPWLTPRYYKIAGEVYGRGPIHVTLPTIKTLNKAQELVLKAAAIAILGIYTRIDDGVFNPATARIAPGAMWSVARNGGLLGPSVSKLDLPGRYDLSQIILNELRMQVKEGLLDQQLPPDGQTPRSASEIMERVKRLALEHMGALGRLVQELIVPAVRRVMEIASDLKLLQTKVEIDQLLVAVQVTSPLAIAQQAQTAKVLVDFLMICAQVVSTAQASGQVVKVMTMLEEIGRSMGVEERHFVGDAERREREQLIAAGVQQAIAAAMEMQKQQQQVAAAAAPEAA